MDLKRDVAVLLPRVGQLLVSQTLQILANNTAGGTGLNNTIHEATSSSSKWIGKSTKISINILARSVIGGD